jgi:hypothetical protein
LIEKNNQTCGFQVIEALEMPPDPPDIVTKRGA